MKITIGNFRNIKSLHTTIQENKINFISGVSGSGKSSLAIALKGSFEELDRPAGAKGIEPTIKTDSDNTPIEIFNKDVQDSLLIEEASSGVYEVIMNRDEGHRKAEAAYNQSMKALSGFRNDILVRIDKIDTFFGQSGIKITGPEISKRCKFYTTKNAVSGEPAERKEEVKNRGGEYLSWLSQGYNFMDSWGFGERKCPFCKGELGDERLAHLEKVAVDKKSNLAPIPSYMEAFGRFGFGSFDLFKEEQYNDAIETIDALISEQNDLKALLNYMDMTSQDIRDLEKPEEAINLSSDSYDQFDGLKESIEKTLRSSKGLRSSFGVLRAQFEKPSKKTESGLTVYSEDLRFPTNSS